MPLYFYAPTSPPCKLCGEGFEHHSERRDSILAECPTCGDPVRRQTPQTVNTPKLSTPVSVSRAKQVGFTVLHRTADGRFERQ